MYTAITPERYRTYLELPEGYRVDGFLACGTWDLYADKHLAHLRRALDTLGIEAAFRQLEHADIGHAYELRIADKTYWFAPVMGTAVMSAYAHTASLLGSQKNLLVGVVGGLGKDMKTAEFILPTAVKGNESALMYDREASDMLFYPDMALLERLKRRLPADLAVYEGPTVTCETMLSETWEDVQNWSSQGYLGVEMEAALIFALSKRFNIPSAALLFVADSLIEEMTMIDEDYHLTKSYREKARIVQYEVAVAELLDL